MHKRAFAAVILCGVMLSGCGGNSPSAVPSPQSEMPGHPDPSEMPDGPNEFVGITDGTWEHGDYAIGEPVAVSVSDYVFTITGPPTMTVEGDDVTVSSPLSVFYPEKKDYSISIAEEPFAFIPGTTAAEHLEDESWGNYTRVVCDQDPPELGQTAVCTLSFTAPMSEIQDFHWLIYTSAVAAWPGQTT